MTEQEQARIADQRLLIDDLDRRIIALLAERTRVVRVLTENKRDEAAVRSPDRVAAVVARVRALAEEHGMPPGIAEATYRTLIEELTQMQLVRLAERRAGAGVGADAGAAGASAAGAQQDATGGGEGGGAGESSGGGEAGGAVHAGARQDSIGGAVGENSLGGESGDGDGESGDGGGESGGGAELEAAAAVAARPGSS